MHLEVLVEDASGSIAVGCLLEKILGPYNQPHSWRIHSYKGVGTLPRDLHGKADVKKRILLQNLPRLLRGYGRAHKSNADAAVIVVVDSDEKDCIAFKQEMVAILNACNPAPRALFRIAIEEVEAWLLGDRQAVERAYPKAKKGVLDRYVQDSICGTWEVLAEAVHPGGARKLRQLGYPVTGQIKCEWAGRIAPHVDVDRNVSMSFRVFRAGVTALAVPAKL